MEIPKVDKGLLERSSSNRIKIYEKLGFNSINHITIYGQMCCMKCGFSNPKPTGKICTCLLCKDCQTCIQMCSRSNNETECDSSRVLLCVADIMVSDLPSDVSISVKNDFLLVGLSNKFRVTYVKINVFLVIESIIVNKHDKKLTSVLINMITSLQVCLTLFRKSTFYCRTHFFKGIRKKAFA